MSLHLFGLDFFWNTPVLLLFIHIVLGSHLKQVTAVLFSSSRADVHTYSKKQILGCFLTSVFQAEISQKIYQKERISMCFTGQKLNLIYTLHSKLLIFIIDHTKGCFFFLSLTRFFITTTYQRFSTGPAQAGKQYTRTKTCFSFQIKDRIILFELESILKYNLRLLKLDSKTILVYHSAITSNK